MNHIRLGPVVYTGLLILVLPLLATVDSPCVDAVSPLVKDSDQDPASSKTAPRDVLRFLDANAGNLKPAAIDKAILRLLTLQNSYLKSYQSQIFSDAVNPAINRYSLQDLIHPRKIKEENIKELVGNLLADGFILSSSEGMIYPEIDYPGVSSRFGRYATQAVAGYLEIMGRETAQHFAEDAALRINPDTLGRRIVAIETYLKENRRFVKANEVRQLEQKYLTAYLIGMNNTPAFNYQTNRLNNLFYQSYQRSLVKYPGTRFAKLMKNYLNLLTENDFQKTKMVLDFAAKAATNG